jgi:arylsulfatase A-like enzyme
MNDWRKIILILLLLPLCVFTKAQSSKPNIIYILADDLGYGDVGCYGQTIIRTPNIDAMAAAGMKFKQHYAGAPVCAPSRAVLMTGRDAGHARVRGNYESGPNGFGAGLELKPEEITIAEVLKQRGYTTGVVGKWGLGVEGTTGEPNKQGFDYSYGFLNQGHAHYQFPDYLFRNGKRIEIEGNKNGVRKSYTNNLFTDEAIQFARNNQTKPFFLYLSYTTPHAELLVPDDSIFNSYKGKFAEKSYKKNHQGGANGNGSFGSYSAQEFPNAAYAASITHLDMCIGKLIAYLKANNLFENTLIIFSSDNGPAKEGGADPAYFNSSGGLRGKKRDVYEGGIRVPMIAVWPKQIENKTVSDLKSGFQDVMITLADVSGKPLEKTIVTEGISFYPTLTGKKRAQVKHAYLYWEFHENRTSDQAILMGNWKAIRHAPDSAVEIYNLKSDSAEQNNVAAQNKSIVLKMAQLMKKARTHHELWPLKTNAEAVLKKKMKKEANEE